MARRAVLARLPFPVLESDVTDVLYLNWVVPVHLAQQAVPPGVTLLAQGDRTVFTVLIYRHGNFGPRFLGPLRRLLPSPLQSNWRFYVAQIDEAPVTHPTVLFVRNFFDSALFAVGARIGSDVLPSELPSRFVYTPQPELHSRIVDAEGELLLEVQAQVSDRRKLPDAFAPLFSGWDEAVATLTLQDSAVVQPPDIDHLAQAGISLPIDVSSTIPVDAAVVPGDWMKQLGVAERPLAFVVPAVRFRVLWERVGTV